MSLGVLVALRGAEEPAVVAAIDAAGTQLRVTRRCADLAEAVACAHAGLGVIVVLDAGLAGVDRAALARLRAAGARSVLVARTDEGTRAAALGADALVIGDSGADAASILQAARRLAEGDDGGEGCEGAEEAAIPSYEVAVAEGGDHGRVEGEDAVEPGRGGVVVVWGTSGAPGRSTVAANLATELARTGAATLLVDADAEAPVLAQLLGLLDETAGVAAACRAATNGTLDLASFARTSVLVEPRLRFCSGLTRADRWRELSGPALDVVWERARELSRWVVVDVAHGLGQDDRGLPGSAHRAAATRSALSAADVVLTLGSADPIGVRRLVQALGDLGDSELVSPDAQRLTVVTKLRAGAAGPRPAEGVAEALSRFAGVGEPVIIPDGRAILDESLLQGRALADVAPRSALRLALRDLAARLAARLAGHDAEPSAQRRARSPRLRRR